MSILKLSLFRTLAVFMAVIIVGVGFMTPIYTAHAAVPVLVVKIVALLKASGLTFANSQAATAMAYAAMGAMPSVLLGALTIAVESIYELRCGELLAKGLTQGLIVSNYVFTQFRNWVFNTFLPENMAVHGLAGIIISDEGHMYIQITGLNSSALAHIHPWDTVTFNDSVYLQDVWPGTVNHLGQIVSDFSITFDNVPWSYTLTEIWGGRRYHFVQPGTSRTGEPYNIAFPLRIAFVRENLNLGFFTWSVPLNSTSLVYERNQLWTPIRLAINFFPPTAIPADVPRVVLQAKERVIDKEREELVVLIPDTVEGFYNPDKPITWSDVLPDNPPEIGAQTRCIPETAYCDPAIPCNPAVPCAPAIAIPDSGVNWQRLRDSWGGLAGVFPFSIPVLLIGIFRDFEADAQRPEPVTFNLLPFLDDTTGMITVDFFSEDFDQIARMNRVFTFVLFVTGLLLITRRVATW